MLAPFFVHEIYFSWPKLIAGALVLTAFLAILTRGLVGCISDRCASQILESIALLRAPATLATATYASLSAPRTRSRPVDAIHERWRRSEWVAFVNSGRGWLVGDAPASAAGGARELWVSRGVPSLVALME